MCINVELDIVLPALNIIRKREVRKVAKEIVEVRVNNAAGTCKRTEQLWRMCRAVDDIITIGSIVVYPSVGNRGLPYYRQPDPSLGSVNELGIPSLGLPYY